MYICEKKTTIVAPFMQEVPLVSKTALYYYETVETAASSKYE